MYIKKLFFSTMLLVSEGFRIFFKRRRGTRINIHLEILSGIRNLNNNKLFCRITIFRITIQNILIKKNSLELCFNLLQCHKHVWRTLEVIREKKIYHSLSSQQIFHQVLGKAIYIKKFRITLFPITFCIIIK